MGIFNSLFNKKKEPENGKTDKVSASNQTEHKIDPRLVDLEKEIRSRNGNLKYNAVDDLIRIGGMDAVPIILRALMDNDPKVCDAACWGIQIPLMKGISREIGEGKLQKALIPATEYLISVVEGAKIFMGASSFDKHVARAIGTLGAIGDPKAIPTLENILKKIQRKIEKEGVVREYINTGTAAGHISTKDDISHIETAIENIKQKEKNTQAR